jgi:hypothetical protein
MQRSVRKTCQFRLDRIERAANHGGHVSGLIVPEVRSVDLAEDGGLGCKATTKTESDVLDETAEMAASAFLARTA